jgi:catechol 2,3-dioxygenase-like lactoylglutathione lyase family enzyme
MSIKLGYTIVYVRDVRQAATFYSDAFGFEILQIDEPQGWAMVDAGGHTLGFSSHRLIQRFFGKPFVETRADADPLGFELDVVVDDLAELESAIASATSAGAVLVVAPQVADDGATIAFLRDPNGVILEIQTPYLGYPEAE